MIAPKFWWVIRIGCLVGLLILTSLVAWHTPGRRVQAASRPQPAVQGTPGYEPPPTTDPDENYPYPPAESASPTVQSTTAPGQQRTATRTPTRTVIPTRTRTGSPAPTARPTLTPTLPVNARRTEDSEMGGALGTPALTETPGPSLTPYVSPTALASLAPTPTAASIQVAGLRVDWGLFWVGFSVPLLVACGLVLYLLDRRPDFFHPRR